MHLANKTKEGNKMQKYYITDGREYIRKSNHKFSKVNSAVNATEFTYADAQRIYEYNIPAVWRKTFYLEGVNDFTKIKGSDMEGVSRKKTYDSQADKLEMFSQYIESIADNLRSLPTQAKCIVKKKSLENMLSDVDSEISDIYHWIEANNPSAPMRCHVYSVLKQKLNERRIIKQTVNYIEGLIECYEKGKPIDKIVIELDARKFADYIPRTNLFDDLTKTCSKNKRGSSYECECATTETEAKPESVKIQN